MAIWLLNNSLAQERVLSRDLDPPLPIRSSRLTIRLPPSNKARAIITHLSFLFAECLEQIHSSVRVALFISSTRSLYPLGCNADGTRNRGISTTPPVPHASASELRHPCYRLREMHEPVVTLKHRQELVERGGSALWPLYWRLRPLIKIRTQSRSSCCLPPTSNASSSYLETGAVVTALHVSLWPLRGG